MVMNVVEKAVAYTPPFVYSKMEGIRSPTGVEAEGQTQVVTEGSFLLKGQLLRSTLGEDEGDH